MPANAPSPNREKEPIQHPQTARAYGTLKKDLAEKFPTDAEAYVNGEDPLARQTESKALSRNHTPEEAS